MVVGGEAAELILCIAVCKNDGGERWRGRCGIDLGKKGGVLQGVLRCTFSEQGLVNAGCLGAHSDLAP